MTTFAARGVSAKEMVRERAVRILNKDEIEGMRKVCKVSWLCTLE